VKARALAPVAPATKLAGVTVGVTPLKIEGVNVTVAGRFPPVASSKAVPSFCVVLKETHAPLAPAYFWFVIALIANCTVVPASTVVPPVLVIVTSLPFTAVVVVPSIPLVRPVI
jgi:hypothetical protein